MSANFFPQSYPQKILFTKKYTYVKLEPRKENCVCVNLYEKMPNFYKKKDLFQKKIIVNFFFIDLITIVVNIDVDECGVFLCISLFLYNLLHTTYIKKILHLYISKKSYNCGI